MFSNYNLAWVDLEAEVGILVGLGLTNRQARVYLALLRTGDAKVQTIAVLSGVNRQGLYRLLEDLIQLGLIQKHVSAPSTFQATPLKEAVTLLLEQKTSQWNRLCRQAKQLSDTLSPSPPALVDVKPCFGTVFEGDRGKKYLKALKEPWQNIEILTSWKRFKQLSYHFEVQLRKGLERGAALRILTEKPPNHALPKWANAALLHYKKFELKHSDRPINVAITIFNKSTTAIAFNPETSITQGPELWTNNPTLTMLCKAYFDLNWGTKKN